MPYYEYREFLDKVNDSEELIKIEAEFAKRFISESVDYASSVGINPHPDYARLKAVFNDIEITNDIPTGFKVTVSHC
jgi:hypothetical protein